MSFKEIFWLPFIWRRPTKYGTKRVDFLGIKQNTSQFFLSTAIEVERSEPLVESGVMCSLIFEPSLKSIRPKLAILSPKKLTKVVMSRNPILPNFIHQKAYSSYIF